MVKEGYTHVPMLMKKLTLKELIHYKQDMSAVLPLPWLCEFKGRQYMLSKELLYQTACFPGELTSRDLIKANFRMEDVEKKIYLELEPNSRV